MKSLRSMQQDNFNEREIKELLSKMELLGNSDIAKLLGWTTSKVTIYQQRGILPDPLAIVGGRPVWAKIQIEKFIKNGGLK